MTATTIARTITALLLALVIGASATVSAANAQRAASSATATPAPAPMSKARGAFISVGDAYQQSLNKEIILIDIRRPDEWKESGIPATATPLTMHQSSARFFGGLNRLTLDKSKPIAIICATGVRTAYLQKILGKYGYTNIINVGEGMYGNERDGVGWLKAGLPIKKVGG